jgi:ribosomal protein S18 acetylase RimI-like enzyme
VEPIAFTRASKSDEAALFDLFCRVRTRELDAASWDEHLRAATLRLQFDAQRRGYRQQWPDCETRMVLVGNALAGWVVVDLAGPALHLLDIAVAPESRGQGIGARIVRALQDEASRAGRPLVLTVLRTNLPAVRLYSRLDFQVVRADEMHLGLEWRPPAAARADEAGAMNDRLRLPFRFDAAAMRADVRRLEQGAWIDHFVKQNYEGAWTVLPLRAPAGATHPVQMIHPDPACSSYVDTPLLALCPAIRQALGTFECPLEAVRLMRLGPQSAIKPHRDHDLDIEHGRVRLHIPIATNPDVDFQLNGARVVLEEGECWYLRLSDPHSVANRGATDRVHLVIDAIVSPWLHDQIGLAHASSPPPRSRSTRLGV